MYRIAHPYISRNRQNIVTYMQAKGLMRYGMEALNVSGSENDFIKMLLSLSNTELEKCYESIDEKESRKSDEILNSNMFDEYYQAFGTRPFVTFKQKLQMVQTDIDYADSVKQMKPYMQTLVKESLQQNITRTECNNTEAVRNEFKTKMLDKERRDSHE